MARHPTQTLLPALPPAWDLTVLRAPLTTEETPAEYVARVLASIDAMTGPLAR